MKASDHYKNETAPQVDELIAKINDIAESLEDFLDNRVDNYDLSDIATLFFFTKEHHAQLDAAAKRFYHIKNRLERGIIPAKMEAQGIDMIRVPEIARSFSRQEKWTAKTIDKDALYQWLRDMGQDEIIQETVNAGTLSSFCRRLMLDEGIEPPTDAVEMTNYYVTGINKYTPK